MCTRCYHCHAKYPSMEEALRHCASEHGGKTMSLLVLEYDPKRGRKMHKALHFDVDPADIASSDVTVDSRSRQLVFTNHHQKVSHTSLSQIRLHTREQRQKAAISKCLIDDKQLISDKMNLEEKAILEGAPRVKFTCKWVETKSDFLDRHPQVAVRVRDLEENLADALLELEDVGATPVCADGKVGGNAAALFTVEDAKYVLVTKSGKLAHQRMVADDFCILRCFDTETWSTEYMARDETVLPTSDSPLHYYGLILSSRFQWSKNPQVVLHGHALETEEEANKLGFPISTEETLFSTKEDSEALMDLMLEFPYPESKIFIRKGHGFLLYGDSVQESVDVFRSKMKHHILENQKQ